jgi:FkbM family methyltransferase
MKRLQRFTGKILRWLILQFKNLCWTIVSIFRKTITISTKQGIFTVKLGSEEAIGKSLFSSGEFELELMSKSVAHIRSIGMCPPKGKGTFIDIGANNGVTSVGMLHTGEFERSIAIEAEPGNFELLKHNVNLNRFEEKIICLPYAVSDKKGELLFEISDVNFGDHRVRNDFQVDSIGERYNESKRQTLKVKCDKLDDLLVNLHANSKDFLDNLSVMWIDIQGYEGYAFIGAKNILSKGIPVVSEIWPYGIRRAGMSEEEYCNIAKSFWSNYWVMRRGRFIKYPIETLPILFDELGNGRGQTNIIFTK